MLTEQEIDDLVNTASDKYYDLGIIAGYEQAMGILIEKASNCFKRKQDDMAMKIRGLSEIMKERATCLRKEYDKKYPKEK